MTVLQVIVLSLLPAGVAVYTFNTARWLWGQGHRRGAAGVLVLAVASLVIPLFVLVYGQQAH